MLEVHKVSGLYALGLTVWRWRPGASGRPAGAGNSTSAFPPLRTIPIRQQQHTGRASARLNHILVELISNIGQDIVYISS
jgi:hypothetical protein